MSLDVSKVIEKLYRDESRKLLAVLARIFGTHNFQLAEDTLQEAFAKAFEDWHRNGIPKSPAAWIMQAAKNGAIDKIRSNKTKTKFAADLEFHLESEWSLRSVVESEFTPTQIKDDQLKLIFVASDAAISPENRLPFILRYLCGMKVKAVANALIIPEATVKKRLLRTKKISG